MHKFLFLASLILIAGTTTQSIAAPKPLRVNSNSANKMSQETVVKISKIQLIAKEIISPPLGSQTSPNLNIGQATVIIDFENLKLSDNKVTIKKVQIRSLPKKNILQTFQFKQPREIILRPLENSQQLFTLSSKIGYKDSHQVQAIITYQIGNQIQTLESSVTEVIKI